MICHCFVGEERFRFAIAENVFSEVTACLCVFFFNQDNRDFVFYVMKGFQWCMKDYYSGKALSEACMVFVAVKLVSPSSPFTHSSASGQSVMGMPRRALLCVLLLVIHRRAAGGVLYRALEEQPPNTLIGSLAADQGLPDSGHLYKLEIGTPYLRVDGKTGDIFTTEVPIDRESLKDCRNSHRGDPCFLEFEVSITDLNQNLSPRLIEGRIEVQDINDNTPQFPSPILTLYVPESTHQGTLFSIPLANDRDSGRNGVVDYALTAGPDAAAIFSLQVAEDRGEKLPQLIVLGTLDREQKDSYDLSIKVVDGGIPPRYSSALLRVIVTDANDNTPRFEKSMYEADLFENSPMGQSVLQVIPTSWSLSHLQSNIIDLGLS